jgi:hypothetical protein
MQIAKKRKSTRGRRLAPDIRRKNLNLDQRLIDRARTALGAATETDAITGALAVAVELADFRRELAEGAAALYGRGAFSHPDEETSLDFRGFQQKTGGSLRRGA